MSEPSYFYMSDAEYDAWRLGTEPQSAVVEQRIRDGLVQQGEAGPVSIVTPYGDIAFSFLIRDQETERQLAEQQEVLGVGANNGVSLADQVASLSARLTALEGMGREEQQSEREHGMER